MPQAGTFSHRYRTAFLKAESLKRHVVQAFLHATATMVAAVEREKADKPKLLGSM